MSKKELLLSDSQKYYLQVMEDLNKPRGDGLKAGLTTRLHEGQIKALSLFYRENKTMVIQPCGRKFGKLNKLDEKIFTPDGLRNFGDLRVGDSVFDEQGKAQKVTYITEVQYDHPAFKVTFDNGSEMEVGAEHLWYTLSRKEKKAGKPGSVKSTVDIFNNLKDSKNQYNHYIPIAKSLDIPFRHNMLIDPYVLGAWLGDGTHTAGVITSNDPEIFDYFPKKYTITKRVEKYVYGVKGLVTHLKKEGLYGNKHIPAKYLLTSKYQRLQLLRGLMDTDGCINKDGKLAEFTSINESLIDDVRILIASLGMKASKSYRYSRFDENSKYSKIWRLRFRPLEKVCNLKRKAERISLKRSQEYHYIKSIEPCKSSPMRCISVTGDSHLYLIGRDLIPTHNTEEAIYFLYRHALLNPMSACYYVVPENSHGKKIVWDTYRIQNFLYEDSSKYIYKSYNNIMKTMFKNKSFIQVIGSENFMAANGMTPHCVVYDEFKGFHYRWHVDFAPNLVAKAAPLLIIGTYPAPGDRNYDQYFEIVENAKKRDDCGVFLSTTFDNPINKMPRQEAAIKAEIEKLIASGDEDIVQREYYSKIIPGGRSSIFPMFNAQRHVKPHKELIDIIDKDKSNLEFCWIADPGTKTCFAMIFAAYNPYTRDIYILDEIYETDTSKTSTGEIVPLGMSKCHEIYPNSDLSEKWTKAADEAAAWFINETLSRYDLYFMPTEKRKGTKEEGLSIIKDQLIHGLLHISDRCVNLQSEIERYHKDANGSIPKKNDHTIDCLRYLNGVLHYDFQVVVEAVNTRNNRKSDKEQKDWTSNFSDDFDLIVD